jgi:hypothetical protein
MKTIIITIAILFTSSLLYSQSNITYDVGTDITVQAGADICADNIVISGTHSGDGTKCGAPLLVETTTILAPRVLSLAQNYPNSFNPTTTIEFTLAKDGLVTLKVYDLLGREVAMLVNKDLKAGVLHQVTFDASRLSTGIYIYRLQSGNNVLVKKLMIIK